MAGTFIAYDVHYYYIAFRSGEIDRNPNEASTAF